MSLEELKKIVVKKAKERYSLYYCINSNMVYGFNSTNNQFTYINKKSINILLYCTFITNIILISKILKIQFQDKSNPLNKLEYYSL